ncbi:hypothetical protein ABMA27_010455 [Loxostege sticticalis]|uniref:Uncharacterized protein n=1 Tax=Loxostege sticticalis TaxID=481309 RepID=A0ABR3H5R6_LOXSC
MEKYLRPEKYDANPSESFATQSWEHWRKTFESFSAHTPAAPSSSGKDAHSLAATTKLSPFYTNFMKPKNILYARHMLATRKQCPNENIDLYLQALKQLSKDCDFAAVDAETNKNDNVREAFISGIQAYNQALSLETAEVSSQSFNTHYSAATYPRQRKCFYCGGHVHPRKNCPALETACQLCNKKGLSAEARLSLLTLAIRAEALLDAGSSITFINDNFVTHWTSTLANALAAPCAARTLDSVFVVPQILPETLHIFSTFLLPFALTHKFYNFPFLQLQL